MKLKKQRYKQITKSLAVNSNPLSVGYMKNKVSVVDERSI